METKPLLYGLIGFFLGGLLVSVAATTFDKPSNQTAKSDTSTSHMSMADMTTSLEGKTGEAFDKAFLSQMIVHHQGAVEMAELAAANARHDEIKTLSAAIISAQDKEISEMRQWQADWGYAGSDAPSTTHSAH